MVNVGSDEQPVMELAWFHRWADDWEVMVNHTTKEYYQTRETYGIIEHRSGEKKGQVERVPPAYIKFIGDYEES